MTKIDILIPAIEKDLHTLPFVIDSVRKYVSHPIGQIFIVSPHSKKIRDLCIRKSCKFVDEKTVLPFTKNSISYRSKYWNRSGWLYQQLLKLNGDKVCSQDYFLVIDADTVLIRPHTFISNGKTVFYCRNWSQPEYFKTYARLMGKKRSAPRSLVAHYMLFKRSQLSELKRYMSSRHGARWYSAIMRSIDKSKQYGFSEYETYGNFIYSKNPDRFILKSALNKTFRTSFAALPGSHVKRLATSYRSLSFHKRGIYFARVKNVSL